ncbi:MAG: HAMP domain-containing protein [Deltaproteobacteria bacterium]|nr:HAMP domain-containing protein [Deltaproteobacteria bacterium]
MDRRSRQLDIQGPDRRKGEERRATKRRRIHIRIPIFIKLAGLSIFLSLFIILTISFLMLGQQKKQFISQLVDMGKSMIHITTNNAPDKLLSEEDLALFQLLNDIAENEQVIYALITDNHGVIKAHSRIEEVGETYQPPEKINLIRREDDVKISSIEWNGTVLLFFEAPITYQDLKIGDARLAISQATILKNIHQAKIHITMLTIMVTLIGVLLSLGLSMYFSRPIYQLRISAKSLGMGELTHRVQIDRNDELGDLGLAFNRMAEDLELNEKIKSSFGRYVTPEIVEMILENPDNQWMKGSEVIASVLFVDIRDFTAMSEEKTPESIVHFLNTYFTRITDIIIKHGGHVNKFVGDEAMAIFGAPITNDNHAEAAVRAALDIREEIARLDQENQMEDASIQVGIGINSGEMLAGNLGSQKKMEYTVIGDNVNVAARLTSVAKPGEILITKRTYNLTHNHISLRTEKRGKMPVKGRKIKIDVFNVLAVEDKIKESLYADTISFSV